MSSAKGTYDAIVVGSGAAGGMAAFQLAMSGVKVLLLEAGRMLDPQKEYKKAGLHAVANAALQRLATGREAARLAPGDPQRLLNRPAVPDDQFGRAPPLLVVPRGPRRGHDGDHQGSARERAACARAGSRGR